jgi:hypothetical protein
LAWHVARLTQADPARFPELQALTGDMPVDRSAERMRDMMHAMRVMKAASAAQRKDSGCLP